MGYLIPESLILLDFIHTAGLTIGYKKIRKVNDSKEHAWIGGRYCDIQFHNMESILQPGFGFGFIKNDKSWHDVSEFQKEFLRKSLNINIYLE